MRLILKILVAPVIVVLTIFIWLCALTLRCSASLLGLAGTLLGIFCVLALITAQTTNGIILLVMAFLVSPVEIPHGGEVAGRQDTGFAVCDLGSVLRVRGWALLDTEITYIKKTWSFVSFTSFHITY
ncbi:MAG: CD1845 family protein [Clostridiaceae bacterium]|nr:CD1845 family protein [Clostridiaceae bacterium]